MLDIIIIAVIHFFKWVMLSIIIITDVSQVEILLLYILGWNKKSLPYHVSSFF
jgi:hypothetical protein